jgi:hypothetical protein
MTVEFDTFVGANSEGEALDAAEEELGNATGSLGNYGIIIDAEAALYEEDPLAGALEAGGT